MVDVRNNQEKSQYEIFHDGQRIGLLAYRLDGDTMTTPHTEIDAAYGGQGYGGQLVEGALDDIRDTGLFVRPVCSFVRHFIATHPEYQDLVKGS